MKEITTVDGRTLAVEEWGVPDGTPVLYAHGTPMSRLARHPDQEMFRDLNVRLITYDRPGFGGSSPHPGRRVVDAADDLVTIADALGLDSVPAFGVSGGGPHVLAFAEAHPDRVPKVAALVSLAPIDAQGLDWTANMMEGNRASAEAASQGRAALEKHLATAESEDLNALLPLAEQQTLARPEMQNMLSAAFTEALRPGLDGWIDDEHALYGLPWGFDPADITVPVLLWHGQLDTLVPVSHAEWLHQRIPGASLIRNPDAGHAGHFAATDEVLRWLLDK